jgi:uncharacterized protein YprB with RNaseH-like and TPR domain
MASLRDKLKRVTGPRTVDRSHNDGTFDAFPAVPTAEASDQADKRAAEPAAVGTPARPAAGRASQCFHVSEKVNGVFHQHLQSSCFVVTHTVDARTVLGNRSPAEWLNLPLSSLQDGLDERGRGRTLDPGRALFVDLETDGFAAQSGCVPFVIGTMRFRSDTTLQFSLIVMHDPSDEAAALDAFGKLAERASMLVTFNGQRFDLPFLAACMARQGVRSAWLERPHLDLFLLARARSGQRARLKLTLLEERWLAMTRESDLPGSEAPARWRQLQQTGDATGLLDVISHNRFDLWTLPALAAALVGTPPPTKSDRRPTVVGLPVLGSTPAPVKNTVPRALQPPMPQEIAGDLRRQAMALRESDPAGSLVIFERLGAALPTDVEVAHALSELYEQTHGELRRALAMAQRAASLAPWSGAMQRRVEYLKSRLM